jgi:hypothetical protein
LSSDRSIYLRAVITGCIAGCQYMPSVEYFAHWLHHGHLLIEACENFQKRSWRNRTAITGRDEPHYLTIPLRKGKHQQLPIRQVEIAFEEDWAKQHYHSLQTSYGKTAFGDEVLAGLFDMYSSPSETLWEFNWQMMEYLISLLPGSWPYTITDDYIHNYPLSATDLRAGIAAGSSHMPLHQIPMYQQVIRLHKPFQPNLSILDALCHLGPHTTDYLKHYASLLYPVSHEGH